MKVHTVFSLCFGIAFASNCGTNPEQTCTSNEDNMMLLQQRVAWIDAETDQELTFASFIAKHGRTYSHGSAEYGKRLALFEQRVAKVKHHNSQPDRLWTAAVNHLTDRTEEELAQLRGWKGFASTGRSVGHVASHQISLTEAKQTIVPEAHTWKHLNAIKADVDQGGCGSCWAVATMSMMNAADEIAGNNQTFAAQDLVDCVPNPHNCGGSGGCDGATVELAMNWIAENGFRTKDLAPYTGTDQQCSSPSFLEKGHGEDVALEDMVAIGQHHVKAESMGAKLGIKYWTRLPENEYEPLLVHLVQHGPLAVSVSANEWQNYGSGIFNSCSVDAVVNHAVVLFAYGVESQVKFWELKNSWGSGWGVDGNIRMLREDTVKCGVDKQPEMGTGCDGGPKEVKVCGMCGILYDVVSVSM